MLKKLLVITLLLLALPMVIAQADIPTYQQGTNITLAVPCYLNGDACGGGVVCDASILAPNGTELYNTETMVKDNTLYKINLTQTDIEQVGQYELGVSCCQGANCFDRLLNFQITPSGAAPLSTGQSTVLFLVLAVIFFVAIIFFIIGFRSNLLIWKVSGFAFGAIMVFILVLYTMFMITEAISGSPNLVSGYETFLFVIRIIGTVLILALVVISLLVLAKAWKIRRGLIG